MDDPTAISDFGSLYRDDAAPKVDDPADALFKQLGAAIKDPTRSTAPAGAPAPKAGAAPLTPGGATRGTPRQTPVASSGSVSGAAPATTGPSSPEAVGMLARLAPLGIKSLGELKSKSDVELRKLSGDVVAFEMRQDALSKNFAKNPDGSFDFSTSPDGTPTGLGPDGKPIPKESAPKPTTPTKVTPKPAGQKPAAAKKAPAKKTTAARRVTRRAPAKRTPAKTAPRRTTVRRPTPRAATTTVSRSRVTAR